MFPEYLPLSAPSSIPRRSWFSHLAGLTAIVLGLHAASSATAQVVSHGFEDGTTQGWVARGSVTLASTTEAAQAGAASLRTTGRTATWQGPALDLRTRLTPGITHQISGWVRLVAGQPASSLKFTVESTPVGGSTTYTQVNTPQTVTDTGWVYLQGNYAMPTGDQSAVTLYLESSDATSAYYLDSFTITALSVAGCPEPADQSGLHADFEDGTNQGWGPRGSGVLTTNIAGVAASGSRSLAVTGRTASWQGPSINTLCKLHKNSKYLISMQVRLLPGEPASQVRVSLQAGLAGSTSFHTVIGNTTVTDAAWATLSTEYTFGLDADQLQLYVETASGTASFYIDDFMLVHLPSLPIQTDIPSIKDVLAGDFPVGAAIEPAETSGLHSELLLKHYSQITAGNSMKWDALQPSEGNFSFARADTLANFARANGLRMRGHTLVWHSQTPAWVFRDTAGNALQPGNPAHRALLLQRMETHIHTVVARYADIVDSWDVVNEVIDESQPGGLRNSPWLQIIGPEFIDWAFVFASEAAGGADLIINDYSTEVPAKRAALRTVVQGLLDRGIPVDGVGHQMHINVERPTLANIRDSIEMFAALGLDNQITEFDMSVYTNGSDTSPPTNEQLALQGYRYRDVFQLYRELSPYISSVTLWGLADDNTWLKTFPTTRDDKPLPFDEQLQAKPAFWGIVDPTQLPVVPKELNVTQRAFRINASLDSVWAAIAPQPLTTTEFDGSWAQFRCVWDGDKLYVLVEAETDPVRCHRGPVIDVFVGDARHTFSGLGRQRRGGADGLLVPTRDGVRLVAAVPAGRSLAVGETLRFDVRVTDAASDRQASWSDTHHTQDTDTSKLGTLTLLPTRKVARTIRGTPVIDGLEDRAWRRAEAFETRTFVLGSSGAIARVRTMWDEGHLYIYAHVKDPLLSDASANPWEEDSIEIFIDANNAQGIKYDGDDSQFRVNFANVASFGGAASAGRIVSATRLVEGGYVIEAAIALDPLPESAFDGCRAGARYIGFDLQVNDDGLGDGVRSSVAAWNDTTGRAYLDPSQFGALELIGAGH